MGSNVARRCGRSLKPRGGVLARRGGRVPGWACRRILCGWEWALGGRQRPGALQSQKGSETETRPARSPDSFATGASAAVESGRSNPHLELGSELELFSDFRSLSGDGLRAPNFIQIEGHAGVFHTGNSGYG